MKTEHYALLVGAVLVGIIGYYVIEHVGTIVQPSMSIDEQIKRLGGN